MSQPNQAPAVRGAERKVVGSHKHSVSAGTVVNLWTDAPNAARAADTLYHWRVTGPFTGQVLTEYTTNEFTFDFDTEGLRAGSYTITVREESPDSQAAGPQPGSATAAAPSGEISFPTTPIQTPTGNETQGHAQPERLHRP